MSLSSISVVVSSLLLKGYRRPIFDAEGRISERQPDPREEQGERGGADDDLSKGDGDDDSTGMEELRPLWRLLRRARRAVADAWDVLHRRHGGWHERLPPFDSSPGGSVRGGGGGYHKLASPYAKGSDLELKVLPSLGSASDGEAPRGRPMGT
jgi:hypothetical protein